MIWTGVEKWRSNDLIRKDFRYRTHTRWDISSTITSVAIACQIVLPLVFSPKSAIIYSGLIGGFLPGEGLSAIRREVCDARLFILDL